jgi:hypothetical protein
MKWWLSVSCCTNASGCMPFSYLPLRTQRVIFEFPLVALEGSICHPDGAPCQKLMTCLSCTPFQPSFSNKLHHKLLMNLGSSLDALLFWGQSLSTTCSYWWLLLIKPKIRVSGTIRAFIISNKLWRSGHTPHKSSIIVYNLCSVDTDTLQSIYMTPCSQCHWYSHIHMIHQATRMAPVL